MSMGSEAVACRSRASTTLRSSPALIRSTAAMTACSHSGAVRFPSLQRTSDAGIAAKAGTCSGPVSGVIVVSHATPARRATMVPGTIRIEPPVAGSKVKLPNATSPVPGRPTSSVMSELATRSASHCSPTANRSAPAGIMSRAAAPQPTRPSPRWIQAEGARSGSRTSRSPGSGTLTVFTVRPPGTGVCWLSS